jgi:ABC-type uncharacterized transport system substrate-binding protein
MRVIGLVVMVAIRLALAPLVAEAQQTEKVRRIGFLSGTSPNEARDAVRQGLREHGYIEGQNLLIEWRFADGRTDLLPGFVAELVQLKVEVVLTIGTEVALATKKATG